MLAYAPAARHDPLAIAAEKLDPNSERARQDREREACAGDVRRFARHCWIMTETAGPQPFKPWVWQTALLLLWMLERLVVTLKARQLGVSWLAAIFALWTAMFRPGQSVLLLSRNQADADKLLDKVAFVFERLPDWLKPEAIVLERSIRFPVLGSEIESMPASKGVGRSRTASLVILDEWAFQPWARTIFLALKAVVDKGRLLGISTANGQGALHTAIFQAARDGQALASVTLPDGTATELQTTPATGRNGFRPVFIPSRARPDRQALGWREQARAELEQLSDAEFDQEYPDDASAAFISTGRPAFDHKALANPELHPIEAGRTDKPGIVIYREPEPDKVYILGADCAEGLATSDWSTASMLDRDSGEQVAQIRGRWTPDVYAERLDYLARHFARNAKPGSRSVILAVERNNHGHAVLLRLAQLIGATPVYTLYRAKDKRLGWITSSATRPVLVDELEAAIRLGHVRIHDAATVDQCLAFAYNDDGKAEAPEGYHDDDVISIGIAWQVRRRAFGRVIGTGSEGKAA